VARVRHLSGPLPARSGRAVSPARPGRAQLGWVPRSPGSSLGAALARARRRAAPRSASSGCARFAAGRRTPVNAGRGRGQAVAGGLAHGNPPWSARALSTRRARQGGRELIPVVPVGRDDELDRPVSPIGDALEAQHRRAGGPAERARRSPRRCRPGSSAHRGRAPPRSVRPGARTGTGWPGRPRAGPEVRSAGRWMRAAASVTAPGWSPRRRMSSVNEVSASRIWIVGRVTKVPRPFTRYRWPWLTSWLDGLADGHARQAVTLGQLALGGDARIRRQLGLDQLEQQLPELGVLRDRAARSDRGSDQTHPQARQGGWSRPA
jgi:hypothetical protein